MVFRNLIILIIVVAVLVYLGIADTVFGFIKGGVDYIVNLVLSFIKSLRG